MNNFFQDLSTYLKFTANVSFIILSNLSKIQNDSVHSEWNDRYVSGYFPLSTLQTL